MNGSRTQKSVRETRTCSNHFSQQAPSNNHLAERFHANTVAGSCDTEGHAKKCVER